MRQLTDAIGIRPLPDEAFALAPSSPLDWVDSTESQNLLNYQNYSFEDFIHGIPASMGFTKYVVRLLSPLDPQSIALPQAKQVTVRRKS